MDPFVLIKMDLDPVTIKIVKKLDADYFYMFK